MDYVSYSVYPWCNINVYTDLHKICNQTEKPINRVHFYVARNKNGKLFLYMRKPLRTSDMFIFSRFGSFISEGKYFSEYGLNCDDFKDLKWEDEPVEVFINMED